MAGFYSAFDSWLWASGHATRVTPHPLPATMRSVLRPWSAARLALVPRPSPLRGVRNIRIDPPGASVENEPMAIETNPLPNPPRGAGVSPATRAAATSELVGRACAMVQASAEGRPPSLAGLARRLGVSPFQLHRAFRATLDISPKQYAEALRAGRLKTLLRDDQ